jgi:ABC-type Fe3+ transport system substrate-binding protein
MQSSLLNPRGKKRTGDQCTSIITGSKLEFIGQVMCPMKAHFKEGYDRVAAEYEKNTGRKFYSYVPTVCGGGHSAPASDVNPGDVLRYMTIDDFPSLAASFDYGDYFCTAFRDRFLRKGYFEAPAHEGINADFADAGIVDPEGEFFVYGGYPTVFLVDRKKLGDLPVPRTWADLLDPIYKGQISIGGGHGRVDESLLMHIYKTFGDDGLARFEGNVAQSVRYADMARLAGTRKPNATAIYTSLYFFAKARGDSNSVELVWPDDGAIFDPAFFLLKKGKLDEYRVLVDYIAGKDFGEVSAKNGFPVACAGIDNRLPQGARLQWLGWDFIHSNDMDALKKKVSAHFMQYAID